MKLQNIFNDRLKQNEPLKLHTNYRIGGPADWYLEVRSAEETSTVVKVAREDGLPIFVLGGGSNILVSDNGVRGLVLSYTARSIQAQETNLIIDAGAITAGAAKKSAEAGLTGFEWAVGVPGTIGGAVRGNAGCYGHEIKDAVESVTAVSLTTGEIKTFARAECGFDYRESRFKHEPWLVVTATLNLSKGEAEKALTAIKEIMEKRRASQPLEYSSAGCIFKNVEFADVAEVPEKLRTQLPPAFVAAKRIPAGWLIEQAGLKGKKSGGAMISEKHGNFFVNTATARAADITTLVALAKTTVYDQFGVTLKEEIQYVGY